MNERVRRAAIAAAYALLGFATGCAGSGPGARVPAASAQPVLRFPEAPVVIARNGVAHVELHAVLSKVDLLPAFSYRGREGAAPTIRVHPGDRIAIDYVNDLPTDNYTGNMSNLHFHGLVTAPVPPGDEVLKTMVYPDQRYHYDVLVGKTQEPGLYWYHPHAHGDTDRQVGLGGMSGAIVVEGIAHAVPSLAKLPERILVLRDVADDPRVNTMRLHPDDVPIDRDSSASNVPCAPIFGRHLTLNGAIDPHIPIAGGGPQFLRFLNASGSRTLDLSIPGARLRLIEADGVALDAYAKAPASEAFDHLVVPPGARIEFTAAELKDGMRLQTACYDAGPDGDGDPAAILATFARGIDAKPETLGAYDAGKPAAPGVLRRPLPAPVVRRTITLGETNRNGNARFAIDGKSYAMDDAPLFTAKSGTVEEWIVVNGTREMHDFHVHQVHFAVESVNGAAPAGPRIWHDSFPVPPATMGRGGTRSPSRTAMLVDFRDPVVRGTFAFHCHLLDHEDAGMMATIAVR